MPEREVTFNTGIDFETAKGLLNHLKRRTPCKVQNCGFNGNLNFSGENTEISYGRFSGIFVYVEPVKSREGSRGYEIPFHFLVADSKTGRVYNGMNLRIETKKGDDKNKMSDFEQILVGQIAMYLELQQASEELGTWILF